MDHRGGVHGDPSCSQRCAEPRARSDSEQADTTPSSQLTPRQRAQRDSFVDSLKQFVARYGDIARKSGQDVHVVGRGLPVVPVLILGFGVLFGPAILTAGLTVLWFRSRRTKGREAGA